MPVCREFLPVRARCWRLRCSPASPSSPSRRRPATSPSREISRRSCSESCQECHHADGVAPMSLVTYEDVRPWAKAIKTRTALRSQRGAMPPLFVEKNIGIQKFKHDPSLTDERDRDDRASGSTPARRAATRPTCRRRSISTTTEQAGRIGEPDLVAEVERGPVPASAPDWWGDVGLVPTGLTEDRYVSAVEVREVNDIPHGGGTKTVGGRYVFHHMTYTSVSQGERGTGDERRRSWPIHEVGRNADIFPPEAGRLLQANSALSLDAGHIHSNGRETKAHLEFAFKFFPNGYKPAYKRSSLRLGNGIDIDVQAEPGESGAARLRDAAGAHQDHRVRTAPARAGRPHVPRGDLGPQHPDAELRRLRPQLGEAVRLRGRCGAAPAEGHDRAPDRIPRHHRGQQESCRSAQLGRRRPPIDRQHVHRPRLLGVADRRAVPGRDGQTPQEHEEPQRLRHRLSAVLGAADSDRRRPRTAPQGNSRDPARGVRSWRRWRALSSLSLAACSAQTRFTYSSGQSVSPAYEGWMPNADGSFTLYFGYMNYELAAGVRHSDRPDEHHRAGRIPIRGSRRTSIRAATRSSSPSGCRRISAPKS